jgi:hypothetical protein
MRRLLTLCMIMLSWTALAGPPSGDGACDLLKGGTPGLYGLCVAFCDAQDLGDPAKAEGKQSAFSLLAAYERKRGPDDPGMPCLADQSSGQKPDLPPPPEAECPCWTVDTLRTALPEPTRCQTGSDYMVASQEAATGVSIASLEFPIFQFGRVCQLQDGISGSVEAKFILGLDDAAVEGCKALWTYHAETTNCPGL